MTSVSGAGYQSKKQGAFDPLNQGHGPAPALAEKADNGPEYLAKEMERQVRFHFRRQLNYWHQVSCKEQTVRRPPLGGQHGGSYLVLSFLLRITCFFLFCRGGARHDGGKCCCLRLRRFRPGPREGEGSCESGLLLRCDELSRAINARAYSRAIPRMPTYATKPWVLPAVSCWECKLSLVYGGIKAAFTRYEGFLVVQIRNRTMQHATSS